MARSVARFGKIALGWLLIAAGLAALVLPGPGLLGLAAGLALLSTEYEWAHRRVVTVKAAAIKAATEGVKDRWRLCLSGLGIAVLFALGILWLVHPSVPGWWPVSGGFWLPGRWFAGATLCLSGILSLAMVIYSYRVFRHPGASAEVDSRP